MHTFPTILLVIVCAQLWAAEPPVLQPLPIQVAAGGRTEIPMTQLGSANYLLVAGSLAVQGDPVRVTVSCEILTPNQKLPVLDLDAKGPSDWWRWRVERDRTTMQRARDLARSESERWSAAKFAPRKNFHLFTGQDDLFDAKRYVAVQADLVKVGRHCLVYVDSASRASRDLTDEIVRVFDERVYPSARRTFGEHRDVDRDGKLTILVTPWLNRLSDGKVALSGFVRGADFYRDVEPPFSNQCDMLYLSSLLAPGPNLTTIIAHEYTHAITFCEHVFGEYLPAAQGKDDEAWLSEAVAHLAENLHGAGWSNLDYRVSTYLSEPNRYRLVVPDYFHEGLWRCHGCRGATYLFLRYCVDRFGEGILQELSRSNLTGVENIETATQTTFADLFRGWSASTAVASYTGESPTCHVPLTGQLGGRLLAGVRPVGFAGISAVRRTSGHVCSDENSKSVEIDLAPTSWTCLAFKAGEQPAQLVVEAPTDAKLQLTLIRMPDDLVSAHLKAELEGNKKVRLSLSSDAPVRWQSVACERRRLPLEGCDERARAAIVLDAASVFPSLKSNSLEHQSRTIDMDDLRGQSILIKAIGRDDRGRPVAAWAALDPEHDD